MSVELKPHRRLMFLSAILLGFVLIIVAQLFRWQVLQRAELVRAEGLDQVSEASPYRGLILDRNGHILALDVFEYEVSASPKLVEDPREAADRLSPVLGLPWQEVYQRLADEDRPYVKLASHVPLSNGEMIRSWQLDGIAANPRPKRVYPEGALAAQVIGFVNEERKSYYGLEEHYDGLLRGIKGSWGPYEFKPARDGCDLVLTIDRAIQYMVERELRDAISRYGAKGGTIIVMEPRAGAILAIASLPSYDPNEYGMTPPELFINPAVSCQYEPGSVVKMVTIAAGLDAGVITPQSIFYDSGVMEVGGCTIWNQDRHAHGQVTIVDILAHSLNVGAAHISLALGQERFYDYLLRFDFGQPTDIDLAGEISGTLKLPGDGEWSMSDLGTNSFGQGIATTPLQMISAISAVANGGLLMKPRVVEHIIAHDVVTSIKPTVVRRVIKERVARDLTAMLVRAVEEGMEPAMVKGYRIAGKTGTAQIPDLVNGGYLKGRFIASFAGYAPADDPQFAVLVKIDEPREPHTGLDAAAPVFRAVAQQLVIHLGIPPQ